jgi:hypothetical protein
MINVDVDKAMKLLGIANYQILQQEEALKEIAERYNILNESYIQLGKHYNEVIKENKVLKEGK